MATAGELAFAIQTPTWSLSEVGGGVVTVTYRIVALSISQPVVFLMGQELGAHALAVRKPLTNTSSSFSFFSLSLSLARSQIHHFTASPSIVGSDSDLGRDAVVYPLV